MKEKTDKIMTLALLGLAIVMTGIAFGFALNTANGGMFDLAFWMLIAMMAVAIGAIVIFLVKKLAERQVVPTSMTDVSEGLADSLLHLGKASGCGCEVYEERLPIDYQCSRVCSEMSKLVSNRFCSFLAG